MNEPERFRYPLDKHAVIVDAGAYRGEFALSCREAWPGCEVISFEPIRAHYEALFARTDARWSVFPFGLSARTERVTMSVRNDSSSAFGLDNLHENEFVQMKDVLDIFRELELSHVDLMKLNIEGGEFDVLERMLDTDLIAFVRFIQIQWHGVSGHGVGPKDAAKRRSEISARLLETHEKEWELGAGIWESWRLR